MRHIVAGPVAIVALLVTVLVNSSCGPECGDGTVEIDGVCEAADEFLTCGVGFKALGGECVPDGEWVKNYCGPNTTFNEKTGLCEGEEGGPVGCQKTCGAAQGNKICLQGRAFDGIPLLMNGATQATPITKSQNVVVNIYDPFDFATSDSPAPLTSVPIDDDLGCFIAESVTIPFTGILILAVEDASATDDKYAFVAYGVVPTFDQNSENLELPVFTNETVAAWGNDLSQEGTIILSYRTKVTDQPVEGITPLLASQPPPWTDNDLFFFDDDPAAEPIFSTDATATTKSGMVAVRGARLDTYGGEKQGCTIDTQQAGVPKNAIIIATLYVSGC